MRALLLSLFVVIASGARPLPQYDLEAMAKLQRNAEELESTNGELLQLKNRISAHYINTDDAILRRRHTEEQARISELPLTRFRAVSRSDISSGFFDDKYILPQGLDHELIESEEQTGRFRNSTIACFVSHVELLESLQSKLSPDKIVLVMEDDVLIPEKWLSRINHALQCVPEDWSLLKVSGWGSSRAKDFASRKFIKPRSSFSQKASINGLGSRNRRHKTKENEDVSKPRTSESSFGQNLGHYLAKSLSSWIPFFEDGEHGEEEEALECPNTYLMRGPFKERRFAWIPLLAPQYNFYYSGSGAYLVKVSSIPRVLAHLRSLPIGDYDSMLLSNGSYRAYEMWPHVFGMGQDHSVSTFASTSTLQKS